MNGQRVVYYFLGEQNGQAAIKIGASRAPLRRLGEIQGARRILAWHPGGFRAEGRLHRRFADEALGHEWFRPSVRLLMHIGTLADGSDPPAAASRRSDLRCGACEAGRKHLCF